MAWYNDGDWLGLRIDSWYNCLYELCYAVNERERVAGLSLTNWNTANGEKNIESEDWTAEDFIGMLIPGASVYENITRLRSAIVSLCESGFFVKYPSGDVITSLDDILPNGFTMTDERPANYTIWDEIKSAIEQLRYFLAPPVMLVNGSIPAPYNGTTSVGKVYLVNDKSTPAEAFETLLNGGDDELGLYPVCVSINVYEDPNNTGYYDGDYIDRCYIFLDPELEFEIVKAKIYYEVSGNFDTTDMTFTCAGSDGFIYASAVGNDILEITTTNLVTVFYILVISVYYENEEGYVGIDLGKPTENPSERILSDNIIARLKVRFG